MFPMHWLSYVPEKNPLRDDGPGGNGLLEAIRADAIERGQTADRVIEFDPDWGPGLDSPVRRDSRCPRFSILPRGHSADDENKRCRYCSAPLEAEGTDG